MVTFTGDYSCRLDEKGRVLLPAALIKQLGAGMPSGAADRQEKFVLKKDIFETCLVLYPMVEWERQTQILRQNTNPYNREHNRFLRGLFKGMADVMLDSSNRLLIPRRLLEEIGADREIVLAGQLGRIEIWAKDAYDAIESGGENIARLAEKIMGNLDRDNGMLDQSQGE